jgi:hypothetical protein
VREAYQAVKYRCVASEQSCAEMMPGKLHIHLADFRMLRSQRDCNLSLDTTTLVKRAD